MLPLPRPDAHNLSGPSFLAPLIRTHDMEVRSLWSTSIEAPPSCVAFHQSRINLLVIGTYTLHREDTEDAKSSLRVHDSAQRRTGSLIVYRLSQTSLHQQQLLETSSAVLDIEWSPHNHDVLAVATSTGSIDLYGLGADDVLQQLSSYQVSRTATLVLDLLWHPTEQDSIAASLSSGEVVHCRGMRAATTSSPKEAEITTITTHSLEPWTLAFAQDGDALLSGGDDMVFQCAKLTESASTPSWSDRKSHTAGVTAIMPIDRHLVVTGSYDDHIRLILLLANGRRRVLAELNLGGGVWRLNMLSQEKQLGVPEHAENRDGVASWTEAPRISHRFIILASCMHAGARVVQLTHHTSLQEESGNEGWSFEVLAKFEEHESMNYGSDASPDNALLKTIVSTSFYDRRVCVWQYDTTAAIARAITCRC